MARSTRPRRAPPLDNAAALRSRRAGGASRASTRASWAVSREGRGPEREGRRRKTFCRLRPRLCRGPGRPMTRRGEPDGRLFLRPENSVSAPVTRALPVFDAAKCTGCRKLEHCRFNAGAGEARAAGLSGGLPLLRRRRLGRPEGAVGETRRSWAGRDGRERRSARRHGRAGAGRGHGYAGHRRGAGRGRGDARASQT